MQKFTPLYRFPLQFSEAPSLEFMCNLVHTQTVSVPSLGASFSQLAIPTLGSSKTLVNLFPGSVWVVNPYGSFVCSSVVMVQFDQIVAACRSVVHGSVAQRPK